MGAKQVVLRQIDGTEILRRVAEHDITIMCGAPAVVAAILDCAAEWDGPIPGSGRTRIIVAGAPPPTRTIERVETELGWEFIQIYGLTETAPLLTMNRGRAEWDGLTPAERAKRLSRAGAPAVGVRMRVAPDGEFLSRTNHNLEGYWGAARRHRGGDPGRLVPHRRRWLPGRRRLLRHQRPQEGRDHLRG